MVSILGSPPRTAGRGPRQPVRRRRPNQEPVLFSHRHDRPIATVKKKRGTVISPFKFGRVRPSPHAKAWLAGFQRPTALLGGSSVAGDETVREVAVRGSADRCSARSRFAEAVKWPDSQCTPSYQRREKPPAAVSTTTRPRIPFSDIRERQSPPIESASWTLGGTRRDMPMSDARASTRSSSCHPQWSNRNVGIASADSGDGRLISERSPNAAWEVACLIPGRLRNQWSGVHRDRALGSANCCAAVRRRGLPSQKSGSAPCVWPLGNRRHRGCLREGVAGQSISPSARARLTASARLCTPSFL